MTLIGLDLTASRIRAVAGPSFIDPAPLPLEGKSSELPLALSLEGRTPLIGAAGTALARCKPHLACLNFLPHLSSSHEWVSLRHRLDASKAMLLVCERLAKAFGKAQGVAAALPAYLSEDQIATIELLARQAKWPWLGSVPSPVAAAQAARQQLPWTGVVLVIEVDGYALTWSAVVVSETTLQLVRCEPCPHLSLNAWHNRLIDGVAHHCIRRTRRDPRESAEAEQGLYDQLAAALDTAAEGRLVELNIQTLQWFQNLMLQPGELAALCAGLVKQSLMEMKRFAAAVAHCGPVVALLATHEAARLPGLLQALNAHLQAQTEQTTTAAALDFGEGLMLHDGFAAAQVHVLPADALAKAAHQLAGAFLRGESPCGHVESYVAPLTEEPADAGTARLRFAGQDYPLVELVFLLGRDPACHLVLESEHYPTVSARHCEILLDRGVYLLHDRSRHGTFVNDQPADEQIVLHSGDWIRLGPGGPLIHFLGQARDQLRLITTA